MRGDDTKKVEEESTLETCYWGTRRESVGEKQWNILLFVVAFTLAPQIRITNKLRYFINLH